MQVFILDFAPEWITWNPKVEFHNNYKGGVTIVEIWIVDKRNLDE